MSHPKEEEAFPCPHADQTTQSSYKSRWALWLAPLTGLAALIWFLIRVIPKPSRATYPCQRAAFPLASGFVVWLLGLAASAAVCRRATRLFARARYAAAMICVVAAVAFVWAMLAADADSLTAVRADAPLVANVPIGEGVGIHPGRVAWIRDANAAKWTGSYSSNPKPPYWYGDTSTSPQVVKEMLSEGLRTLTGTGSDYAAWDALFKNFNERMGRGKVGYQPGEKIGIKINFVLTISNTNGTKTALSQIDCSPQLTIALLKQLTDIVGVEPNKISIGDPSSYMPDYWYNKVEPNCPGVVYLTKHQTTDPTLLGRTPVTYDTSAPFYWSEPNPSRFKAGDGSGTSAATLPVTQTDLVPTPFSQATYFINFAILKSHTQNGITVCGKNLYGALRKPDAPGYYSLHQSRALETPGMGHYRCLVDLMSHPKLGGKTLLYLIDGLYGGQGYDARPVRWTIPPFNGNWPSSVFLSQDPVAIDSVAFDFLFAQWTGNPNNYDGYPQRSGTEDYLHEAALVPHPPSGTVYDPNHGGGLTHSLGVHEHWNNVIDKQYSRNLDPNGTGIELSTEPTFVGDFDGNGVVDANDLAILNAAMGSHPGDANWNPACDISVPSDGVINYVDLALFLVHTGLKEPEGPNEP